MQMVQGIAVTMWSVAQCKRPAGRLGMLLQVVEPLLQHGVRLARCAVVDPVAHLSKAAMQRDKHSMLTCSNHNLG